MASDDRSLHMSSTPIDNTQNDFSLMVMRALRGLRFGSVEIVVHDGRVVQIERRERVRLEPAGDRPPDRRGRGNDPNPRTDRSPGGSE